jgi:hypothetical protein
MRNNFVAIRFVHGSNRCTDNDLRPTIPRIVRGSLRIFRDLIIFREKPFPMRINHRRALDLEP